MATVRIGLAACGVIVAITASGCTAGVVGGSAYKPPAWAKSLGPGVTVTDARVTAPAAKSPAGVVLAQMNDMKAGKVIDTCSFNEPSDQSACKDFMKSFTPSQLKSALPTIKNFTVTYTAVDGDQALVGATGSICHHNPKTSCATNTDPAAILDSGKSFAVLWKQATAASNASFSAYALNPLVKIDGVWYSGG